ncbi:MAG: three-Cys-motif partner protein TcmP, partial [candidate division Zixibacteria bacterium]|nr:three-Cys-motif partner protein TcmP [candidate division Zixibacteria bacterium]
LFLLDPYGIHLDWEIIYKAGQSRAIEIFLNFPVPDMNRNMLRINPEKIDSEDAKRMERFWGDTSYRQLAYSTEYDLFGHEERLYGASNAVVKAFKKRLGEVAGFKFVPEPIPMRNRSNAIMYYLFFASPNATGAGIVRQIFAKFKDWKQSDGGPVSH